jgi:hypothetical protein
LVEKLQTKIKQQRRQIEEAVSSHFSTFYLKILLPGRIRQREFVKIPPDAGRSGHRGRACRLRRVQPGPSALSFPDYAIKHHGPLITRYNQLQI